MVLMEIEQKYAVFEGAWEPGPDGSREMRMLIAGRWQASPSGETFDVTDPCDGSLVARVPQASPEDIKAALDAAYDSRSDIAAVPAIKRIEMLNTARDKLLENRDVFVDVLMREAGKIRSNAESEVNSVIERLGLAMEEYGKILGEFIPGDWSKDTVGKMALVFREPIGVVAAISPFNYPLFIGAVKVIPALLAGNAVVVKPPSEAPSCQILFAKMLLESGFPASSINVVTGSGARVGDLLLSDERLGMVSFTGSTQAGRKIAEKAGVRKLHLELGGKAIALVLDDADVLLAAERCAAGAMNNSGQRCDAVSMVLVHKNVAEEFIQRLVEEVERWKLGRPDDPEAKVGPLINDKAAMRVERLVNDAVGKGAEVLTGGGRDGLFFQPTVLDHVAPEADIAWEEQFGPVVPVIRVESLDEALEIANRKPYGLDACVFTNNFYSMCRVANAVEAGQITVNDFPRHGVGLFPFGGDKESGIGREGIGYSIEEMTRLKTLVFNMEPVRDRQKTARERAAASAGG